MQVDVHQEPQRWAEEQFAGAKLTDIRRVARVKKIAEGLFDRQYAEVFRDHPFLQPPDQVSWLRQMLDRPEVRTALHLT